MYRKAALRYTTGIAMPILAKELNFMRQGASVVLEDCELESLDP
jgi:hypothetical protein